MKRHLSTLFSKTFRFLFFTLGLYLVLCGIGLFAVDEVILTQRATEAAPPLLGRFAVSSTDSQLRLDPPEWLPLTCLGLGGVTLMYAIALPTK